MFRNLQTDGFHDRGNLKEAIANELSPFLSHLKLLEVLRAETAVPEGVIDAAIGHLGSGLVASLGGDLGMAMQAHYQAELARLEARDFREKDHVDWKGAGGSGTNDVIVSCDGDWIHVGGHRRPLRIPRTSAWPSNQALMELESLGQPVKL